MSGSRTRPVKSGRRKPKETKEADAKAEGKKATTRESDASSVFIRGLPEGTTDKDLRVFLEARVGAVVTCFVIRDDYGIAKFQREEDARRCLQELNGTDFNGSSLKVQAGKPKRGASAKGKQATTSEMDQEAKGLVHLRSIQLGGVPPAMTKEKLRQWIEERLPGGCGIEAVRRVVGTGDFTVSFRKDQNARRALESLSGADMNGHTITASLRALELSRQSSKAGRLIVRNLSFDAREKHLRKVFEQIGELADVHLPSKDGKMGAHRGFAFVQYAEASAAEKAVASLNGSRICGRAVAVDWAVDASVFSKLSEEPPQEPEPSPAKHAKHAKPKKQKEKAEGSSLPEPGEDPEPDPDQEVKRMKELLGDDVEEDDDEDEEEEEDGEDDEDAGSKPKKDKPKASKARKPGFDVEQGLSIFVRNVPFDAEEGDLKEVFRRFGRVSSIKMVADKTGQNAHRGSAFIKFAEAQAAQAALAAEEEAERKLKELSSVVRRSDQRELPAVEGFGVSLKGRRLVLKPAVKPQEASELSDKTKMKGQASKERRTWMHLLNVGDIPETSPRWDNLSKSEQRQRIEGQKERKWRINNSNFAIHPQRISIRNLPTFVDANKLREAIVKHLAHSPSSVDAVEGKKGRLKAAQEAIVKASMVRDDERRTEAGERRSKGYGFVTFKDHDSAMKALEFLNDNPTVFGGNRRPIVEFAVEDKRKLRMQEELRQRYEEKLKKKGQAVYESFPVVAVLA
ncbi:Rbm28 [Symbiodinium sp. CCMP2592]|nr:Rbm28 [Symbiodinium sp. CCMP2592]